MEVEELLQLMKDTGKTKIPFNKDNIAKFYIKLFTDGSGTLTSTAWSTQDEEIFEFQTLDELYKFLKD